MSSNKINWLQEKANKFKEKIKKATNLIEKLSYEIDFYDTLKEIEKINNNLDNVVKYKKLKLEKELEYINLVEEQRDIKFSNLEEFLNREFKDIEFLKTGIRAIDNNLGGIPVGVMIQFAAASFAGKTTTLMRIAVNLAKLEKVAHFNFEMSEPILYRIYAQIAKGASKKQLKNVILPEDVKTNIDEVVRSIKLLNYREGVRVFIIDSRMKIKGNSNTAKDNASEISAKLSELVRELEITIILINQLSEEAIKENKIIIKESGDQKYDADIVLGLGFKYERDNKGKIVKDEMGQPKKRDDVRLLICDKNRLGKNFTDEIYIDEILPSSYQQTVAEIDMPDIPL